MLNSGINMTEYRNSGTNDVREKYPWENEKKE